MAMGKRNKQKQTTFWLATDEVATSPGHPFYSRLNALLDEHGFDGYVEDLCREFYHDSLGRPDHSTLCKTRQRIDLETRSMRPRRTLRTVAKDRENVDRETRMREMVADKGYHSNEVLTKSAERKITLAGQAGVFFPRGATGRTHPFALCLRTRRRT